MADRRDVLPHQLLRAVLVDDLCREVLQVLGVDPDEVLLTLDRRWLAASDYIEVEEVEVEGVDLPLLLRAVNPPFDAPPDWGGRQLTDRSREFLVRALGMRDQTAGAQVVSAHVMLALMTAKDPIVGATFRDHGLTLRAAKPVVQRWLRRA